MRTIRQNLPPVFDEQGRAITVQKVIQGDGPPIYLGMAEISNGQQAAPIRFKIEVDPDHTPFDQLEEAFARFDGARDSKMAEIKAEMRKAALRV